MIFKISLEQQEELKNMPETGMGYQLVGAKFAGEYFSKEFIALNSELLIENDYLSKTNLREIFAKGFNLSARVAIIKSLKEIKLIDKRDSQNLVKEGSNYKSSAKDNPVIYPDGNNYFVRLSAYDNDKRIDKKNNCLLQGSYTTIKKDYEICVKSNDKPIERYALPNDEKISWAFHIKPKTKDGYRFGTVQPAFGKTGGGEECFFENGTSFGTFNKQTTYGVFYP